MHHAWSYRILLATGFNKAMGSPRPHLSTLSFSRPDVQYHTPHKYARSSLVAPVDRRPVIRSGSPKKGKGSQQEDVVVFPAGRNKPRTYPEKSLMETRGITSFNRNLEDAINCLQTAEAAEDCCIPEQVLVLTGRLETIAEEVNEFVCRYRADTVWEDVKAFGNLLENAVQTMRTATAELKHYIPSPSNNRQYQRSASLESLESATSDKETCAQPLKAAVYVVYDAVRTRFNDYVRFVSEGFAREPRTIDRCTLRRVAVASSTMSVLGMLVDFETAPLELDPRLFSLAVKQNVLGERQQRMLDMFRTLCRHLMFLQESLFVKEFLVAKGPASISLLQSDAKIMKSCWNEVKSVFRRMTRCCPMYTDIALEYYGRHLWHAASLAAGMQDASDLTDYLEDGRKIPYDADVVRDIAKAQLWLLPVVTQIIEAISHTSRKIKRRVQRRDRPQRAKLSKLVQDLKRVVYDLVVTTIGRASWLITYTERSSSSLLRALMDQGTKTLRLVLVYSKSNASIQCDEESTVEDVTHYSALVCATSELRNVTLQLQREIERLGSIAEEEPEGVAGGDASTEQPDAIGFHQIRGTVRLQQRLTVRTHPVQVDGSAEFDLGSLKKAEKQASGVPMSFDSDDMADLTISPWAGLDSFVGGDGAGALSSSGELHRDDSSSASEPSTDASLDLQTAFADLPDGGEGRPTPTDRGRSRESADGEVVRRVSRKSDGSSPFAEQQPTEHPADRASGWGVDGTASDVNHPSDSISVVSSDLVKNVPAADLTPGPIIGEGSEGHVLQMSYHKTPVAVKIMNRTCMRTRERFKNEAKLLNELSDHPNIVNFLGQCRDLSGRRQQKSDLVMVMEYCDLGNLFKIVSEARWVRQLHAIGKEMDPFKSLFGYILYSDCGRRLRIACDIAAGAAFMHQHSIVHRDLTSYNVVLKTSDDGSWTAKICDFERSRKLPRCGTIPRSDNVANSPAWSSPEVLREEPYSVQSDVFSFGVILWELWTLEEPWRYGDCDVRNQLLIIPLVGNGERLKLPAPETDEPFYRREVRQLIQGCWNDDPRERPTMQECHDRLTDMIGRL